MTTKLDKPLRREVVINDRPHTLTLTAAGFKLVEKGHRNGIEVEWQAVIRGDGAPGAAPNAPSPDER